MTACAMVCLAFLRSRASTVAMMNSNLDAHPEVNVTTATVFLHVPKGCQTLQQQRALHPHGHPVVDLDAQCSNNAALKHSEL